MFKSIDDKIHQNDSLADSKPSIMVSFEEVEESNSRIEATFPPGLVAVFVGGIGAGGIGELTIRRFVECTKQPRI